MPKKNRATIEKRENEIIAANPKRYEWFRTMFAKLVEKYGVPVVYRSTTVEILSLGDTNGFKAIFSADHIKSYIGLTCYRRARMAVLYSEENAEESRKVRSSFIS